MLIIDIIIYLKMNISLTEKQKLYIQSEIEIGDFQNASELVRDALRLHQLFRQKVIIDLKNEIEKGFNSGISKRTVSDIIDAKRLKND